MTDGQATFSVAELARELGVQERTIRLWLEAGCPRGARGKLDKAAVLAWRGSRRTGSLSSAKRGQGPAAAAPDPSEDWHARAERADALIKELKLEQARGDVIPRTDVAGLFAARCTLFRRGLERLQRKLAPRLVGMTAPAEVQAVLAAEFRALLEEYSADDPILRGQVRKRAKGGR